MTSASLASIAIAAPLGQGSPAVRHERPLRLLVKTAGSGVTGQVDGAWWPYSRDLVGELLGLLPALAARLGRVERVSYRLAEWDPPARKVDIGGTGLRLGGFASQSAHTVDVIAEQHRVTLLVIPPDTALELASSVLTTAGTDLNAESIAELLFVAPAT